MDDILTVKNIVDCLSLYEIRIIPFIGNDFIKVGRKEIKGLCNTSTKIIYINSELDFTERKSVCIHELLHAISDVKGLRLTEKEVYKLEKKYFNKIYKRK